VNLEGVKRIMALEAELVALREELTSRSDEARANLERTHRQYRRDLVPVSSSLALVLDAKRRSR
jgi:MerR family transcriptional regulator/heat shock protein HspR